MAHLSRGFVLKIQGRQCFSDRSATSQNRSLAADRVEGVIEGNIPVAVISRADLIRNKLASGREQDLLDVKNLRSKTEKD